MLNQFKLLTIDHHPESLNTLKDIVILHPGYHVTHLDSTALIYEIMHYQGFDMALCDFAMASKNSFRLVHALRKANPHIAVILLTVSDEDRFSLEALEAGADGFFNKPLTYEKFSLTLEFGYWKALHRIDWWEANRAKLGLLQEANA